MVNSEERGVRRKEGGGLKFWGLFFRLGVGRLKFEVCMGDFTIFVVVVSCDGKVKGKINWGKTILKT